MSNREIKFRAWTGNEMFTMYNEGFWAHADNNSHWPIMQFTGLKDKNGKEIYEGDRIRFHTNNTLHDGEWDGTVVIEDGVVTVSIMDATNVTNPDGWKEKHDWIKSRWWSSQVGYGEFGNWNAPRAPLTKIHRGFKDYKKDYQPLCEDHGYGHRYLNVTVLGNIHENPELCKPT